jgi:hypothetical protein
VLAAAAVRVACRRPTCKTPQWFLSRKTRCRRCFFLLANYFLAIPRICIPTPSSSLHWSRPLRIVSPWSLVVRGALPAELCGRSSCLASRSSLSLSLIIIIMRSCHLLPPNCCTVLSHASSIQNTELFRRFPDGQIWARPSFPNWGSPPPRDVGLPSRAASCRASALRDPAAHAARVGWALVPMHAHESACALVVVVRGTLLPPLAVRGDARGDGPTTTCARAEIHLALPRLLRAPPAWPPHFAQASAPAIARRGGSAAHAGVTQMDGGAGRGTRPREHPRRAFVAKAGAAGGGGPSARQGDRCAIAGVGPERTSR